MKYLIIYLKNEVFFDNCLNIFINAQNDYGTR